MALTSQRIAGQRKYAEAVLSGTPAAANDRVAIVCAFTRTNQSYGKRVKIGSARRFEMPTESVVNANVWFTA